MPERSQAPAQAAAFRLIGFGVGVRIVGTAVGALAGVVTIALAVRLLGTSTYGLLAFATSVMTLVAGLGRLGLEAGVTRSVTALGGREDRPGLATLAKGSFVLVFLTGVVGFLAVVVTVLVASLGGKTSTELALGAALGVALFGANAAAVSASFARGLGRMALMEASSLTQTVGRLIVIGTLASIGVASLGAVALGYALVACLSLLVALGVVRKLVGNLRIEASATGAARGVLVACMPFAATSLAVVVISRFDALVLGFTGSSEDVGLYEPTLKIVEQVMLLAPLLFVAPYLPAATRLVAESGSGAFRELYVAVSKLVYVIAVPAIVLFVAFPETTLHGLYGEHFPAHAELVWILLAGFVVNLVFGLNGSALAAIGNRDALVRVGIIGTVSMVLLAATLVPAFGPTGAAAATSTTYLVINVVTGFALLRGRNVHPFARDFAATLLLSLAPVLGGLAIRRWASPDDLWTAAGWSIGLSAAWAAGLVALRVLRPQELRRLLPAARRA